MKGFSKLVVAKAGAKACACLAALALVAAGCSKDGRAGGPQASKKKVPSVAVASVARGDMQRVLELTGDVVPIESAQISATVEGPVGFLPWREGDRVTAGQRLVGIDRELFRADVAAAEASLALARAKLDDLKAGTRREEIDKAVQDVRDAEQNATFERSDYGRITQLVESGALSPEEGDKARVRMIASEARLKSARIQLEMLEAGHTPTAIAVQAAAVKEAEAKLGVARARLDECQIHAPFGGIVTRVFVRQGDMAAMKTPLLALADLDTLVVRCAVPEAYASEVRTGMTARLRLDAMPDRPLDTRVTRVFPELDARMRTRTVELGVAGEAGVAPGMFGRVRLTLATVPDAVSVPAHAVNVTPNGSRTVFVYADGRVSERQVRVGIEQAGAVQIVSGLQPEERVVVKGMEKLKDGAEVQVNEPAKPASAQAGSAPSGVKNKGAGR